ncbi:cell division protein FtsQ/DivIB [Paracoccus laeviglucosivorans]|uniref:Cell division protein FtsQ n=1 Tax=Paracoccus laeviglucosivorans TaxID=1197861 RepID=A0A521CF04_9RHOB|nr:cell division protein FtsQ/DivIB [Paracoccus laeviglucosivorans]SMO58009.1 cell division protein FtsQ [Paracoccus laeviglucosivorans]
MQGLNPFTRGQEPGRPAPVRHAPMRPAPQAKAAAPRRDPAPSRLAYRLNRMMLRPLIRRLVRIGLPAFLAAMVAGIWLSDDTRRANLSSSIDGLVDRVQHREAFMVHGMEIEGASEVVDKGLRAMLPVDLPASSFEIDLEKLRERVLKLDAVEAVELRIQPGGILSAVVTERVPAVLWRHARGIELLDKTGHRVASATSRDVRSDLPIIAGEGANRAATEALALIDAAGPILPRLRGLERVGERRWDVVLDRGQRIKLPEDGALRAFENVIATDRANDMLKRDITVIDLREQSRPVVQIGLDAQNAIRRARGQQEIGPDGKPIDPATDPAGKNKTGSSAKKTG